MSEQKRRYIDGQGVPRVEQVADNGTARIVINPMADHPDAIEVDDDTWEVQRGRYVKHVESRRAARAAEVSEPPEPTRLPSKRFDPKAPLLFGEAVSTKGEGGTKSGRS